MCLLIYVENNITPKPYNRNQRSYIKKKKGFWLGLIIAVDGESVHLQLQSFNNEMFSTGQLSSPFLPDFAVAGPEAEILQSRVPGVCSSD